MLCLCLDTALDACSVALVRGGGPMTVVWSRTEIIGKGHAERLIGQIDAALAATATAFADLDRLVVTIGPGRFTGLRGLALATGLPIVGVSTLSAIARAAGRAAGSAGWAGPVLTCLDARRGEV